MKYLLTLLYCLSSIYSFSQIDKKDLYGDWYSKVNIFRPTDTIILYNNKNLIEDINNTLYWRFSRRNLIKNKTINTYHKGYSEQNPIISGKYTFEKSDFGQFIVIEDIIGAVYDFKIIDLKNTQNNDTLILMRPDFLSDQKLYNHVDSLVYQVLKYDSTKVDSIYRKMIHNENLNVKIIVRDRYNEYPKPFLIINEQPIKDFDILKKIRLVEMISCTVITNNNYEKVKAVELYGYRALNGVILLQVSRKRYKQILKQQRE